MDELEGGQDGNYKQFTVSDGSDNPYPGMEIGYFECTNMNEYERWNLRNRPPPPRRRPIQTATGAVATTTHTWTPCPTSASRRSRPTRPTGSTDDSCADSAFQ